MKITFHQPQCLHEQGQRENNEDSIYPAQGSDPQEGPFQLYLVCDGVGGLAKGEVASKITCDVIADYLLGKATITESDIDRAVFFAEQEIDAYIQENIDALGMATTLTLLSTHDEGVTIAHIGDSRIYHIRGEGILHKTFDHSFTNELVAKNIISEGEAVNHPKRNVVTKAIKAGGEHERPDFKHFRNVEAGDYFFLCTDGIIESVTDDDLVTILNTTDASNEDKIETIRLKCEHSSKDNHSAYLLQIKEVKKDWISRFFKDLSGDKQVYLYGSLAALAVIALGIVGVGFNRGANGGEVIDQEKIDQSLEMLDSLNIDELEPLENDSIVKEREGLLELDSLGQDSMRQDSF